MCSKFYPLATILSWISILGQYDFSPYYSKLAGKRHFEYAYAFFPLVTLPCVFFIWVLATDSQNFKSWIDSWKHFMRKLVTVLVKNNTFKVNYWQGFCFTKWEFKTLFKSYKLERVGPALNWGYWLILNSSPIFWLRCPKYSLTLEKPLILLFHNFASVSKRWDS